MHTNSESGRWIVLWLAVIDHSKELDAELNDLREELQRKDDLFYHRTKMQERRRKSLEMENANLKRKAALGWMIGSLSGEVHLKSQLFNEMPPLLHEHFRSCKWFTSDIARFYRIDHPAQCTKTGSAWLPSRALLETGSRSRSGLGIEAGAQSTEGTRVRK